MSYAVIAAVAMLIGLMLESALSAVVFGTVVLFAYLASKSDNDNADETEDEL